MMILMGFPIKFISICILIIIFSPLPPSDGGLLRLPTSGNISDSAYGFQYSSKKGLVLDLHELGAVGDGLVDVTQELVPMKFQSIEFDSDVFQHFLLPEKVVNRNIFFQLLKEVWKIACSCTRRSRILVPMAYKYLVGPIDFAGPCRNKVTVSISGTLVAPDNPDVWKGLNRRRWLYFINVKHLTVDGGGTINGMGAEWWAQSCKRNSTNRCRPAPTAITFHKCKYLKVSNLQVVDSQQMHMAFTSCCHVKATNLKVEAPGTSPNTDGIHISSSSCIEVKKSLIGTGDDCISIVGNSSKIQIRDVVCGPGHGISIGSLGKSNTSAHIHDVLVESAFVKHTQNGLRIKTWQGGSGVATKITFKNIRMENVSHPIIVDQYYCDSSSPCLNQTQAVKVANISFIDIRGTSASHEAIRFACSDSVPCRGIYLKDIQLVSHSSEDHTRSFCWNAYGSTSGLVYPPPCLSCSDTVIKQKVTPIATESM